MNGSTYRSAVAWMAGYLGVSGKVPTVAGLVGSPLIAMTAHLSNREPAEVAGDVQTYMSAPDRLLEAVENQSIGQTDGQDFPRPMGVKMSYRAYKQSQEIAVLGYEFEALVMAAMRQADSDNAVRLRVAFPATWTDLQARYNAPGGTLAGELPPQEL